jgi:hypothetical protein
MPATCPACAEEPKPRIETDDFDEQVAAELFRDPGEYVFGAYEG